MAVKKLWTHDGSVQTRTALHGACLARHYRLGEWCHRFSAQFKRLLALGITDGKKAKLLKNVVGAGSLLFFPSSADNEESPLVEKHRFDYEIKDLGRAL